MRIRTPSKKNKSIKEKQLFSFPQKIPQKSFQQKAKYRLTCGAIIYKLDNNTPFYLLLKYPTYWGFVKGGVEPGETEEKTINREAAEEAGLYDLSILPKFRETQHYFHKYEGQLIRSDAVFFIAETHSWKIKISHEHETYKWCTYEQAMELMKLRANRELITKANIFLNNYYNLKKLAFKIP